MCPKLADPPPSLNSLAGDELGPELLGVVARLHRWATRHAALPISPALARLLAQVEELQPSRIGDLAKADHCTQPTMTLQIQRLEEQGLVSRSTDPADSRAVLIVVTHAGLDLLRSMRAARADALAPMLDSLTRDDRRRLVEATLVLRAMLDVESSQTQP